MSALANLKPASPSFNIIEGYRSIPMRQSNPRLFLTVVTIVGFVAIAVCNLLLNIATSAGVYQMSHLKSETKELALNTQVLSGQVASLSSDQNLANAAQALGMESNANPVFLNVTSQTVYGKPLAAVNSTAARLGRNLIANSALTSQTTAQALKAAESASTKNSTAAIAAATTVATGTTTNSALSTKQVSNSTWASAGAGYVGGAKSSTAQVNLPTNGIPAAPTH